MALAGIHNGLQLKPTQGLGLDEVVQMELVGDVWGLHRCQGGGLHHGVGVGRPQVQLGGHVVLYKNKKDEYRLHSANKAVHC